MVKRFEWDERKARRSMAKHGLAFEEAPKLFLRDAEMQYDLDVRFTDEARFFGFAKISRRLFHVVFVVRNGSYRIVEFRAANRAERKYYEAIKKGEAVKKRGRGRPRPLYRQDPKI